MRTRKKLAVDLVPGDVSIRDDGAYTVERVIKKKFSVEISFFKRSNVVVLANEVEVEVFDFTLS